MLGKGRLKAGCSQDWLPHRLVNRAFVGLDGA
jgi:hypothetical protein